MKVFLCLHDHDDALLVKTCVHTVCIPGSEEQRTYCSDSICKGAFCHLFENYEELMGLVNHDIVPDVVVIDVRVPMWSATLDRILKAYPDCIFMVYGLDMFKERSASHGYWMKGAVRVLSINTSPQEIADAVQYAMSVKERLMDAKLNAKDLTAMRDLIHAVSVNPGFAQATVFLNRASKTPGISETLANGYSECSLLVAKAHNQLARANKMLAVIRGVGIVGAVLGCLFFAKGYLDKQGVEEVKRLIEQQEEQRMTTYPPFNPSIEQRVGSDADVNQDLGR